MMRGQLLLVSPHLGWVLLETGRQNLSTDDQEDLFVPTLGKPVTKEKGQSPGSRKWVPRCQELALADPLALGLRGTEDCASHERPQDFALCPCPLVSWPSLPPLTLLHSLICLPKPSLHDCSRGVPIYSHQAERATPTKGASQAKSTVVNEGVLRGWSQKPG